MDIASRLGFLVGRHGSNTVSLLVIAASVVVLAAALLGVVIAALLQPASEIVVSAPFRW